MIRIDQWLAGYEGETSELLKAAVAAALKAGEIIDDLYGNPHQIRMKGEIDLVTEADIASEKAIIDMLTEEAPGVKILSEESNSEYEGVPPGPVWIIDPLDGTTNFAHGFPYFCVSIAYSVDGNSQLGVIYCPPLDELFWAVKGKGAWLNGKKIKVSGVDKLIESLVATGFPYDIRSNFELVTGQVGRVLPVVQDLRRAGAAALDLAYVACGRLDGFWEIGLKPWDTAAGQLLVEEAGGVVTDFKGDIWSPYLPRILASNGKIHYKLSRLL